MAFTPDSKKLVVGGHHELNVFDATTGLLEKHRWYSVPTGYGHDLLTR
jgi:hypothetical protein